MTGKSKTDNQSNNINPRKSIYKKLINKGYRRMKKSTTMSRSYDLKIGYIWLLGYFLILRWKHFLTRFLKTKAFCQNTDQMYTFSWKSLYYWPLLKEAFKGSFSRNSNHEPSFSQCPLFKGVLTLKLRA